MKKALTLRMIRNGFFFAVFKEVYKQFKSNYQIIEFNEKRKKLKKEINQLIYCSALTYSRGLYRENFFNF